MCSVISGFHNLNNVFYDKTLVDQQLLLKCPELFVCPCSCMEQAQKRPFKERMEQIKRLRPNLQTIFAELKRHSLEVLKHCMYYIELLSR